MRLFGPFRLDAGEQRLWKGGEELKLRRKPLAILHFLTLNPRRLVTPQEIVEAVWGRMATSESLLRTHISEVRRVLGEGAIETVMGRGYRFLLGVDEEKPATHQAQHLEALPTRGDLVGREAQMDVLQQVFQSALDRRRQVVFVTGDPGIGKTALTDAFLAQIAAPNGALIARGSCVEQYVTGEAYLPVLAALGAVYRETDGERVIALLGRHAPTWLVQMPGLVRDENLQALHLRVQGATQARMLRELAEALDVIAAERPLVLVLEDMQWSDPSTTDLVAMLGVRREPARLLVIATCRPTEVTKGGRLAKAIAELSAHKQALTMQLDNLPEAALAECLAQRFRGSRFPDTLAGIIHRMTGGNPLFAVAVIDDLERRRMIRPVGAGWRLEVSVAEVASRRPDTVRQLIDIQMDRLSATEQRILEAASLVGARFAAGSVGHALELPADEVDSVCETLAYEPRFLRFVGSHRWPDGTIQSHYDFVHALYRDAAFARIPSVTRRSWHRRVAAGLEDAYGGSGDAVAAELALHFEEASITGKAVQYHCLAGERAMRRFGRVEAQAHFTQAQALVSRLPASDESERAELVVLKHMGPAIAALHGFEDPRFEQTFMRAAELARKLDDPRGVLAALVGLQRWHFLRGELAKIELHEGEVAEVLSRLGDPMATADATVLSSSARLYRGQLAAARGPLDEACQVLDAARSDPARAVNVPVVGYAPGHIVVLSWLCGAPDEAMARAGKMLALAESLRNPFHLTTALTITALAHRWRGEPERALELGHRAVQLARDAGLLFWQARAMSLYHWAATVLEPRTAKVHFEELSSALPELLEAAPHGRTAFTPSVAEVYARAGHVDRAMRELDDALAFVEVTDERAWSSELHRTRGELLKEVDPAEAERAFTKAVAISRAQGARSLELRAASSLAKLNRGRKRCAALDELRRVYSSFDEGFETADLVEARTILAEAR